MYCPPHFTIHKSILYAQDREKVNTRRPGNRPIFQKNTPEMLRNGKGSAKWTIRRNEAESGGESPDDGAESAAK
jgi:hypothetical protein